MSYYASYDGEIHLRSTKIEPTKDGILRDFQNKPIEDVKGALDYAKLEISEEYEEGDEYIFSFYSTSDYNEDCVEEALTALNPITVSGEISYKGEDASIWRFIFKDGEWTNESGQIVYEELASQAKSAAEFAAACFRKSTEDEIIEKAIKKAEEDEEYSIMNTISEEMASDGDDETSRLLRFYQMANEAERSIMDYMLVSLCGWTMNTIIEKSQEVAE